MLGKSQNIWPPPRLIKYKEEKSTILDFEVQKSSMENVRSTSLDDPIIRVDLLNEPAILAT
jgi:hypothetical protein